MQTPAIAAAVAILIACTPASGADELVHLTVKDAPAANGKTLDMDFKEIERTAGSSIVEVSFASGSSVASSLFVMRGMCAVTRARGEKYFTSERVATGPTRYKVAFPSDPLPAQRNSLGPERVVSLSECALLQF
jgi:hypothetical protein